MRRAWPIALLILAAALVWLQWPDHAPAAPTPTIREASRPGSAVDADLEPQPPTERRAAEPAATAPPADESSATATTSGRLRIRLLGLHPMTPWTAPLQVDLTATRRDGVRVERTKRAAPDADGRAAVELGDDLTTVLDLRIWADDRLYLPLRERRPGPASLDQEIEIRVFRASVLTGRILSAAGRPLSPARAAAYLLHQGQPTDRALAMAETDADGRYRLLLPPTVTVWVMATASRPRPSWIAVDPFAQPILGQLAPDHLPTAITATAPDGGERELPDLVLAAPSPVTGSLRWSDGTPIADAEVAIRPTDGVPFSIGRRSIVQRHADGRLSPCTVVRTGGDGSFSLPAQAGTTVSIELNQLPATQCLLGPLRQYTVVAPHTLPITLPRPVTLRVQNAGRPSRATIEIEGAEAGHTNDDGLLRLVTSVELSVRASHERLRSPWQTVSPAATGTTIDLDLAAARQPVLLQLEGSEPLLTAAVSWRRDDGEAGSEVLRRHDASEPLQLFLEPGRYRLTIAAGAYGASEWLLPVEREVTIDEAPVVLTAQARFGGTFTVTVTDSSGRHIRGTCRVADRNGVDHTDRFRVRSSAGTHTGAPGELLDHGHNEFTRVLPAGDFELLLDLEQHGAQRQSLTIRAAEVRDVHIRLP